jgi:hypothetical protein
VGPPVWRPHASHLGLPPATYSEGDEFHGIQEQVRPLAPLTVSMPQRDGRPTLFRKYEPLN